ncbi:hypothetical protein ACFQV8_34345 [Pseudonocardia benzenivorans]
MSRATTTSPSRWARNPVTVRSRPSPSVPSIERATASPIPSSAGPGGNAGAARSAGAVVGCRATASAPRAGGATSATTRTGSTSSHGDGPVRWSWPSAPGTVRPRTSRTVATTASPIITTPAPISHQRCAGRT